MYIFIELRSYGIDAFIFNKYFFGSWHYQILIKVMKLIALSRGLPTATSPDRIWTPFNPYDPSLVHKLLLIHRVYYNFVKRRGLPKQKTPAKPIGKGKGPGQKRLMETPAMRLGIANSPYTVDDILYSKAMAPSRRRGLKAVVENKPKSFLTGPEPQHVGMYTPQRISLRSATRMERRGFVYLDVETTGTAWQCAIVEIAVVDDKGKILVNTLVKPPHPIPKEVTKHHGITDEDVDNSPVFSDIEKQVAEAVRDKYVVMYNARFDIMFLPGSVSSAMIEPICCMERFAVYAHEAGWVDTTVSPMSLIDAVSTIDAKFPGRPHRALPDALACRLVWRHMFTSPKPRRRIPQAFVGI